MTYEHKKGMEDLADTVIERIIEGLKFIGEEFVVECRQQPGDPETAHSMGYYIDRTTNLRNSIGYLVQKDGVLIEGEPGSQDIPDHGIYLAGTAGMSYASHVEAKGYNVISRQREEAYKRYVKLNEDIRVYVERQLSLND